jgi:hypothetical protein
MGAVAPKEKKKKMLFYLCNKPTHDNDNNDKIFFFYYYLPACFTQFVPIIRVSYKNTNNIQTVVQNV